MDNQSQTGKTVLVHMLTSDGKIACNPGMNDLTQCPGYPLHPGYQRTNEPRAVTCFMCKKTAAYKIAMEPYK